MHRIEHYATMKSRLLTGINWYERHPCYVDKCSMTPMKLKILVHIDIYMHRKKEWKDTYQNIYSIIPDC